MKIGIPLRGHKMRVAIQQKATERLIHTAFATWQSASVRAFDMSDPFQPRETGYFVPPQPTRWMEPMRGSAKMCHTGDLFVAADGLISITVYDAGLSILQWGG